MHGLLIVSIAWVSVMPLALAAEGLSERQPAEPGEICIVCGRPTRTGDPAYLYQGQRVALCAPDEAAFLADPAGATARLRPNNIMMSPEGRGVLSSGWILIGVFGALGVIFGGLCALSALKKGLSPFPAFLLGFFFSVPAYLYMSSRSMNPAGRPVPGAASKYRATRDPAACPECGRALHPSASRCAACGKALEPGMPSEARIVEQG